MKTTIAQPSGTDTAWVGDINVGTKPTRLQIKTKRPMLPIIATYFCPSWPTLSSSRSRIPTPIEFVSSASMHCCVPPGRSTEIRVRSHKKKTAASAKTTISKATWLGIGNSAFSGWMCKAASNAPTGLPSKRFSAIVTHSNPSPISTLSGTRLWMRAANEKLPHHFHQNRGNHGKKTGQQARYRRSKGPQNSIRSDDQQSVAPQEFQINTGRKLRALRSRLRRGKPRQRIPPLLHPAIVNPGEDRSGSQSRRCPTVPHEPGRSGCGRADSRNQPFDAAFRSAVKFLIPRHWRRRPSFRRARVGESHPTPPRRNLENRE